MNAERCVKAFLVGLGAFSNAALDALDYPGLGNECQHLRVGLDPESTMGHELWICQDCGVVVPPPEAEEEPTFEI